MKTGIHIEGGKYTRLQRDVLTALSKALILALDRGQSQAAQTIAQELAKVGGVHGTVISNNIVGDKT